MTTEYTRFGKALYPTPPISDHFYRPVRARNNRTAFALTEQTPDLANWLFNDGAQYSNLS